jgi:hypothetical protein
VYRLRPRDDSTRTRFPGRAGRPITGVRALSHTTTLIPIKIGNERLRPTNVKSDATLHAKSAERKHAERFLGLDNAKRRCSLSASFNLVSENA